MPSLAGPKRPQDRIDLPDVKKNFLGTLGEEPRTAIGRRTATQYELQDGSVVIAAITSCTNTSNPSVMMAAGLLAKKAVEKGLKVKPWVKTSLAPGSKVVMRLPTRRGADALSGTAELPPGRLRLHHLHRQQRTAARQRGRGGAKEKLVVAAVLSGNRNFEGRINPLVRANYLASPPLVVAYALAGRVDIDLQKEPLGTDQNGQESLSQGYLADATKKWTKR